MTKWLSYPFFYEYTVFLEVTSSKSRSKFFQNLRNNFQKESVYRVVTQGMLESSC